MEVVTHDMMDVKIWISFQGNTSVVVPFVLCFGVEFLCCLYLMYVFIFLFKFGYMSGRQLGNSCSLGLRLLLIAAFPVHCLGETGVERITG